MPQDPVDVVDGVEEPSKRANSAPSATTEKAAPSPSTSPPPEKKPMIDPAAISSLHAPAKNIPIPTKKADQQDQEKCLKYRVAVESRIKQLEDEVINSTFMLNPKLSLLDMPDLPIMRIIKYLDLRSRLKIRGMHSRLYRLESEVKRNVESIKLEISSRGGKLHVKDWGAEPVSSYYGRYSSVGKQLSELVNILSQLSTDIRASTIQLIVHGSDISAAKVRIIKTLLSLNFEADDLETIMFDFRLPQLNLPTLLSLGNKYKKISIVGEYNLNINDLCTIRKAMIDGLCKLESLRFDYFVSERSVAFVKKCFGVTIKKEFGSGFKVLSKIFHCTDESMELYANTNNILNSDIHHFEGDIQTTIIGGVIAFKRSKGGAKPDKYLKQLRMNHLYECEEDDGSSSNDDSMSSSDDSLSSGWELGSSDEDN